MSCCRKTLPPRKLALNSLRRVVDTHENMYKRVAPMSNTERQRRFRERHPGYYGRLHRKRKAASKAMLAQRWAEARAQAQAEAQASLATAKTVPLMLPPGAPVLDPLASKIAALAESLKARSAAVCELVPAGDAS